MFGFWKRCMDKTKSAKLNRTSKLTVKKTEITLIPLVIKYEKFLNFVEALFSKKLFYLKKNHEDNFSKFC